MAVTKFSFWVIFQQKKHFFFQFLICENDLFFVSCDHKLNIFGVLLTNTNVEITYVCFWERFSRHLVPTVTLSSPLLPSSPQGDRAALQRDPGSGGRLWSDEGTVRRRLPRFRQLQEERSRRRQTPGSRPPLKVQDVRQVLQCKKEKQDTDCFFRLLVVSF